MDNLIPASEGAAAPLNNSDAVIVIQYSNVLISPPSTGTLLSDVAPNPLVSLYQNTAYQNGYDIYVVAFVPHGATNIGISFISNNGQNVTTVNLIPSGTLTVRGFQINYTYSGTYPNPAYYDIWQIHCLYQVNANQTQAQGVITIYNDEDPVTTRGTITTVMKS